jgi:hypothetical protein
MTKKKELKKESGGINKSQGQTLNWVGLYLPTPVFSHGQLYIACSRVTSRKNLKILFLNGKMRMLHVMLYIQKSFNRIYTK